MTAEKPLSRERLHQILSLYHPGVTVEVVGGYDTGVYFRFKGRIIIPIQAGEQVGGRLVREFGFTSEAMEMSRDERFGRAGLTAGITRFEARYQARLDKYQQWLLEYCISLSGVKPS